MYYTIYKITNKLDGKFYVGKHQTKDLNDGYMGSGVLIRRAIEKHGVENFQKEILHVFETEAEMNEAETRLVVISEESYNLCPGGQGGFGYINSNPEKFLTEKRLKSLTRVKDRSPNLQKKWKEQLKKAQQKDSYKKNQSEAQKKRNREKGSWWVGKQHRQETLDKMKVAHQGKHSGSKNSQYGTCWITNGSSNKKISKNDLDFWIEQGYYKGRILGG
jgi:hypothetical protein